MEKLYLIHSLTHSLTLYKTIIQHQKHSLNSITNKLLRIIKFN